MDKYDEKFYNMHKDEMLLSAENMLPFIMDIFNPKSVIDVGCGVGSWLYVFKKLGVDEILGLDGEWVSKEQLLIPEENFIATDLENPKDINRKFDLAMSLEVAEHLSPSNARQFIKFLTDKSSVVLFSAAIPGQGGTNHVNEQWPEYWNEIFKEYGFQILDIIRWGGGG